MRSVGPWTKRLFAAAASAASGKHVCVLPREARDEGAMLEARAPYRVDGPLLRIELGEQSSGTLEASLLGYQGHRPSRLLWASPRAAYRGPSDVGLDLATGVVTLQSVRWGSLDPSTIGGRFCWRFSHASADGIRRRMTSHYRADRGCDDEHGEAYYSGGNYVDYDAESAGQRRQIIELLDRWRAAGPLLEIGCATGSLLSEIEAQTGLAGVGVDISAWAVAQAAKKLGPDRVWQIDLDRDRLPSGILKLAPFRTIVMFSVLEHLTDPRAALAALTDVAAPGALLLLETTNCDSLCHRLFSGDWEGYFDRTHRAVDRVGAAVVPQWLTALGWQIAECHTRMVWDGSADPTHATLRDWWDADARFRRLLRERDLGDLLFCAAVMP